MGKLRQIIEAERTVGFQMNQKSDMPDKRFAAITTAVKIEENGSTGDAEVIGNRDRCSMTI